ncbi:hypothetical protein [Listeria rocourtiae]|uniref:hypothetical protein n=1 Tax=Listeria rocourtiae TaxID=647910 RepID=UPI0004BC702D|nr:hypothetical protein [Listeria rocourtiae]
MKKINKVKINGLNVPLAIDVHKEILIDWSKEAVCQRHYHLAVIHDGKCIYQEKKTGGE